MADKKKRFGLFKPKREKGIRTLINEIRPCWKCGAPNEILAVRKMVKQASPGEYETSVQMRQPTQKTLDEEEED